MITRFFKRLSKDSLSQYLSYFFSFLYPPRCPICGQIPPIPPVSHIQPVISPNCAANSSPDSNSYFSLCCGSHIHICPDCYASISFITQPYCYTCGKPLSDEEQEFCHDCLTHPKSFTRGFSLTVYNSVTKPSLAAIKYKNKRQYLDFYAIETIKTYGSLFLSLSFDAILSVPIHKKRLKKRGYNQASLFAHHLGKYLSVPVYDSLLIRKTNTLPQKNLSPDKRLQNLKQAFSLYPGYENATFPFQRILLVDDIYTTGSTMEAITCLLKEHGVQDVYIFSICIGNGII